MDFSPMTLGKAGRFALTHLPVRAIDAGRNNIDYDLAECGHGIRHLEFQNGRHADQRSVRWVSSLWRNQGRILFRGQASLAKATPIGRG